MSDFPKGFAGTEHYRERVASIQSWLEGKRCFGLEVALRTLVEEQNEEVEALCDHIEEQLKENAELRERVGELRGMLQKCLTHLVAEEDLTKTRYPHLIPPDGLTEEILADEIRAVLSPKLANQEESVEKPEGED